MANDFPGDDTIQDYADNLKRAARGQMPLVNRRKSDKFALKDWIGYILAVLMPVMGSLLLMWKQQGTIESELNHVREDISEIKQAQVALWRAVRDKRD